MGVCLEVQRAWLCGSSEGESAGARNLSSVKVMISLRLLPRRLVCIVFVCWFGFVSSLCCAALVRSSQEEDVFMRLSLGCGEMPR